MRRLSRSRKGMFEEQFNWLFVLVAGAVIIFFFFHFLSKQQELAQQKIALTINTEIESISSGVESAENTAILIDIPKSTLSLDCSPTCDCNFGVQGSVARKPFGDLLMFGPKTISGPQMVVWSRPWEAPYTVASFLYLTSPNVRYVVGYIPGNTESEVVFQRN